MCGVCACGFSLMCLCVVLVMCCVMVHSLYVLCVCVGVSFNVLVCGVGGLLFGVVWFAVVCDCFVGVVVVLMCVMCL